MATAASAITTTTEVPTQGYFATCGSIAKQSLNGEDVTARIDACAAYFDVPVGTMEEDVAEAASAYFPEHFAARQ